MGPYNTIQHLKAMIRSNLALHNTAFPMHAPNDTTNLLNFLYILFQLILKGLEISSSDQYMCRELISIPTANEDRRLEVHTGWAHVTKKKATSLNYSIGLTARGLIFPSRKYKLNCTDLNNLCHSNECPYWHVSSTCLFQTFTKSKINLSQRALSYEHFIIISDRTHYFYGVLLVR